MVMTAVPGKFGALDEAGFQACHLAIVVMGGVGGTPRAIIPLSNEPSPILDVQLDFLAASLKRGPLISVGSSGQNIDPIKVAGRKVDGLSLGYHGIRPAATGQLKENPVELDFRSEEHT